MKSPIYEIVAAQATAPGAAGAAAAIAPGSGTTQLSARSSSGRVNVFNLWAYLQSDGFSQPVWNSGHDPIRNFRVAVDATNPFAQKAFNSDMLCNPNEDFTITLAGSATAGDVESFAMLLEYPDLGGATGTYIDAAELARREAGMPTTVEMELTGTAAGWTGSRALTAVTQLLKAGHEYAVLGMVTDIPCAAIGLQGPGTGNYLTGCPGGTAMVDQQSQWFLRASALGGRPCIPVINADDSKSTLLSFLQNENNIAPNITLFLSMLKK